MNPFTYRKVRTTDDAFSKAGRFLAGGTTLIDLMKLDVEKPDAIIDVNALPFLKIETTRDGLSIGAGVKNSDLAHNATVVRDFTVLSQALLSGASAQLRNKATTAGNLLQRTRCLYFRDPTKPCNKRDPGSGCGAMQGFNRNLAILGVSEKCIASNPSDMNVAMMALEASVHTQTAQGTREIPIGEFYLLPGETPQKETVLAPGELITHVSVKSVPKGAKSYYLKLRDRQSYEFALASAAVIVRVAHGKIDHARIAMGGIGTIPWRMPQAERLLEGQAPSPELFARAAEAALNGAKPQTENGFKVELAKRCLIAALTHVTKA